MADILVVGNATLDVILTVDGYPSEDAEVRASARRVARGGNAANTLVALSQWGHHCSWGGVLADTAEGRIIRDDLHYYGIDTGPVRLCASGVMPVSCVILNARNGSRTIVHHRDLPEYRFDDFRTVALGRYQWVHFEGRNVFDTQRMLARMREQYPDSGISLEIEKPRTGIDSLYQYADVLIFSRHFAEHHGFVDPLAFLQRIRDGHEVCADLFCTWGSEGAAGMDRSGRCHREPAQAPGAVVDTLGAGDVFNAAVIDGYLGNLQYDEILRHACRLAGLKCTGSGFANLALQPGAGPR
jgi:ketohexokinase